MFVKQKESSAMSGEEQERTEPKPFSRGESLSDALDRSAHELQLLANFYHQHGYTERAQEIYRTILRIRSERDARDKAEKGEERASD